MGSKGVCGLQLDCSNDVFKRASTTIRQLTHPKNSNTKEHHVLGLSQCQLKPITHCPALYAGQDNTLPLSGLCPAFSTLVTSACFETVNNSKLFQLIRPVLKLCTGSQLCSLRCPFSCWPCHQMECALSVSRSINSKAFASVDSSTTGGALPASSACFHREAHRHHLSPGFNPGKKLVTVLRSLPCAFVYSKNSSVTLAQTA